MNVWHLSYGQTNYAVHLTKVPLWRVVVEESYLGLLSLLGDPCCWRLAWIPTERLSGWVALAQFKLINNPLARAASGRHEKRIEHFPVTEHYARLIDSDLVDEVVRIFSDDD